jgi:DNA repair protein RecO (recombination protein O)
MPAEKAQALVLRTTDWSESSRIATVWTREFGKVRVLAKGGRRLKSNFENALDLLTLCRIVFLRKSSSSLDLLTEAQVVERFPRLRSDLPALYAAYYIAELLSDWTEDYDPHPLLFDEALAALRTFGQQAIAQSTGPRLARFELVLLRELGYTPTLTSCAVCGQEIAATGGEPRTAVSGDTEPVRPLAFSPAAGGMICPACLPNRREALALSPGAWQALRDLSEKDDGWQQSFSPEVRAEVRRILNDYVTYLLGRRPRLLPYLGS